MRSTTSSPSRGRTTAATVGSAPSLVRGFDEVQPRANHPQRRQQPRPHHRQHPVRDAEGHTLRDRPQPTA